MDKDGYKDRFLDGALSQATYKDKLWGVPVENTTAGVFFYDKELFKKYNVEVPKTYDELTAACETFKAAGIAPFALGNKFQWPGQQYYMYLALRLGGAEAFTDAAEGKGAFNSEPFVKAYEMLQDMIKKDYFNKGYNTLDTDAGQPKQLLYSGKAAMYLNGTWEVQLIQQENPDFTTAWACLDSRLSKAERVTRLMLPVRSETISTVSRRRARIPTRRLS